MMLFFNRFLKTFLGNTFSLIIKTNATAIVLMLVFTSLGAWKYFNSSVQAFHLTQVADHTEMNSALSKVVTIGIDNQGYEAYFGGASPVSRPKMTELLEVIKANIPATSKIVIDIDLSPTTTDQEGQARLNQLLEEEPGKWIIPAIQASGTADYKTVREWQESMCKAGVQLGLPYLPTEFGYPKLTHQYSQSLARVATQENINKCVDPSIQPEIVPMPLQAHVLSTGTVLPFAGDLELLAQMLTLTQPSVVFLGGMWGQQDVYGTPFGDRRGVQIHAAAYASHIAGDHIGSRGQNLLSAWGFMSILAMVVLGFSTNLKKLVPAGLTQSSGSVFFHDKILPVLIIGLVFLCLYIWLLIVAAVHSLTGLWLGTAEVCIYVVVALVFKWNFCKSDPKKFKSWSDVGSAVFPSEIKTSFVSLKNNLFGGEKKISAVGPRSFEIVMSLLNLVFLISIILFSAFVVLEIIARDFFNYPLILG